ncbi:MAG: hypothetical protein NTX26_01720 [Candidatus Parcubacteria bacterium]|nr:hypothetical protein [Candidatus Parcubacteria bacterium]
MKQAYKTLFFFSFVALAIYYTPKLWRETPGRVSQFLDSSQMANFIILINKQAEQR